MSITAYLADQSHKQAVLDAFDCDFCLRPGCIDCHELVPSRIPKNCDCSLCQPGDDLLCEDEEWPIREDGSDVVFCVFDFGACGNLAQVHFNAETMQWSEPVCESCSAKKEVNHV